MIVDLHCHSTASDGSLAPAELLARASERRVDLFSVTDHDTVAAYQGLQAPAGLSLIPGVEMSCVWSGVTIHVIGLGVDLGSSALAAALSVLADAREQRAHLIGRKLAKLGFADSYDGARAIAGSRAIGRPDFARFLCKTGAVNSMAEAFDRYLGAGKVGDIKAAWPRLSEVLGWITASGGVAVLAHPFHYRLTATKLRALLTAFRDAGGEAMEVINGNPRPDEIRHARRLCEQFSLEASIGSDFHQPGPWNDLGRPASALEGFLPVWQRWYPS